MICMEGEVLFCREEGWVSIFVSALVVCVFRFRFFLSFFCWVLLVGY